LVKPYKWHLVFSKRACKDARRIKKSNLKAKVELLLDLLAVDPLKTPPDVKSLTGDLLGYYSRRINIQHRLVYSVDHAKRQVRIISMWHHYE
jgi:toxin YoeB